MFLKLRWTRDCWILYRWFDYCENQYVFGYRMIPWMRIEWVYSCFWSTFFFFINVDYHRIVKFFNSCVRIISVGNKNDAPDRKVVITEDAQRFADYMNIQLFETSAKDNINVEEVIINLLHLHNMRRNDFIWIFQSKRKIINERHRNYHVLYRLSVCFIIGFH